MEKLNEINIKVKNHMSYLEEDELNALYDHIGVIRREKKDDENKEKTSSKTVKQKTEPKKELSKKARSAPRIIRKTKVIIDTKSEDDYKNGKSKYGKGFNDFKRDKNNRYGVIKSDGNTSGLRPGYTHNKGFEYKKEAEKNLNRTPSGFEKKKPKKIVKDKPEQIEEKKNLTKQKDVDKKPIVKDKTPKDKAKESEANVAKAKPSKTKPDISKENKKQSKKVISKPKIRSEKEVKTEHKPIVIPKPEKTPDYDEQLVSQKNESRREQNIKDVEKTHKREHKKDAIKAHSGKNKKFKPEKNIIGQKKGIKEVLSDEFELGFYEDRVKKARKGFKGKKRQDKPKYIPPRAVLTSVKIPESISVKSLSETLKKTSTEVIKKLMGMGLMVTVNNELDFDTASIVADEFGITAEKEIEINEEDILFDESEEQNDKNLEPRPPVVVVMGHVDHGKTLLLDAIRETDVIESEAGGITQHIGAYTVTIKNKSITFLDTPGHEAFTAMRARGAQITDIAILVVAADDGVMPQTIEAINHAKDANISIIVAINKIDKPGANPDRVKQELTEHGLVSEEWGGDTIFVQVSAKKRENIDNLLEMILLTADVLELKADQTRQAKGTVIEAKLDKNRGPIATMLVQRGILKVGNSIVTGTCVGRIRVMSDDKGHSIKDAGPSIPVEVVGMTEVPVAGETFYSITDEKIAKQLVEKRKFKQREKHLSKSSKISLDDLFNQIKEGNVKELKIIVKADVQGSVEAVKQSLEKLTNEEVRIKIIHGAVGAIKQSDVSLAEVSNAIIIGFNVRPDINAAEYAERTGVDMRLYRVIYDAIEDIEAAMKGMLDPMYKELVQGHAEVRQIFKASGIGTIAGCYVLDGKVIRNSGMRVVRDGIVVHEGKVSSLKRFKDDAKEVLQGYECGITLEKFNDIKEKDIIETYIMEEVKR